MQKYALMFGISLVGSFVSFLIGSMDSLVMILLCFVIADYVTGLIASAIEGRLSSQVGFRGIVRKLLIFVLVAVSHLLEIATRLAGTIILFVMRLSFFISQMNSSPLLKMKEEQVFRFHPF
uniref:Phage-related holin (Lysis protein)-like protein n=1 Tax=Geobacillus sp. (strain WCH70) TaxID=471223 RepID=C5D6T6_GEOSW